MVGDGAPAGSVRWSDETFRMFGYEPGAFPVDHARFFEFIHPEDRDRIRNNSPVKLQNAQPFENDLAATTPGGQDREYGDASQKRAVMAVLFLVFGTPAIAQHVQTHNQ